MIVVSDRECGVAVLRAAQGEEACVRVNPISGLDNTILGRWQLTFNDEGWGMLNNLRSGACSWVKEQLDSKVVVQIGELERYVIDRATKARQSVEHLMSSFVLAHIEVPLAEAHPSAASSFAIKLYRAEVHHQGTQMYLQLRYIQD